MSNEYNPQDDVIAKLYEIAYNAGLQVGFYTTDEDGGIWFVEGDFEEGDFDISHIDGIAIGKTEDD